MFRRFTKKRVAVGLAVVGALALAVGAYAYFTSTGTGSSTATWIFTVTPGQFRVSTTWLAYSNRATNAPYTILDGSTSKGTILVNQQAAPSGFSDQGGTWQDLGTFTISGNQLVVQLTNNANGYVIADAVRIERIG